MPPTAPPSRSMSIDAPDAVRTVSPPDRIGRTYTQPPDIPDSGNVHWAAPSGDGSIQHMTLETLLAAAAVNNPTLQQAQLHVNATLSQAMQAGLYPNPTAAYSGEQIGVGGTAGEWHGLTVEQRIVVANKLGLSRQKFMQRARVAEHLAVAQQFRVCNDVKTHFYKAIAANQVLALRQELLKSAEDGLKTHREMYNLGQANRADVHRANTSLQRERLSVMMARNEVRQSSLSLASLAGIEGSQLILEGSLFSDRELLDFDAAWHRLASESPEVAAANAKLREDCIKVQREKVEWVPDLVFSGGAGYNFEAKETVGAAGLAIEIPLFDRNQGTIAQAEADWQRQRAEVRRTQLRLQQQLSAEYSRYLTALQHVLNYDTVVLPESKEAYRLALTGYKASRTDWPTVLEAQRDYTGHRIEYIQHQLARRVSEVMIDGFLLHGGLDAAASATPPGHIDSTPTPR